MAAGLLPAFLRGRGEVGAGLCVPCSAESRAQPGSEGTVLTPVIGHEPVGPGAVVLGGYNRFLQKQAGFLLTLTLITDVLCRRVWQ